jgi:hypothetical protein
MSELAPEAAAPRLVLAPEAVEALVPPLSTGSTPVTALVKEMLVNVLVEPLMLLPIKISLVLVPISVVLASGRVIVLSALGLETVNVVSKASAEEPSKTIAAPVFRFSAVFIVGLVKEVISVFAPLAAAPRFVLASAAVAALVPPLAIGSFPVTEASLATSTVPKTK